jgi:NADPH:quinone reductase
VVINMKSNTATNTENGMTAYVINAYGEHATFVQETVTKPSVVAGYVLVEVKDTSLNPADHKILKTGSGISPQLPSAILHGDVAGVVAEVGGGVTKFAVGDEVYGCAGGVQGVAGNLPGALADYMLADADLLAHKPKVLSFSEAAALPLVSIAAWEGLFSRAAISSNGTVLIHGGTGGVGHIALQLAKQHGARVVTTVSTQSKADIAIALGADETVLYRDEAVENYVQRLTNGNGFDVVFDTVGGESLDKSLQAAAIGGQVVGIMAKEQHDLLPMHLKGLSLHIVMMLLPMLTGKNRVSHQYILREVAQLADEKKIRPLLHEQRFIFSQANEAHALYASGQYVGKIVLENK